MLARFDQAFGTLDRQLRNPRVALDVAIIRTRHQLCRWMRAAKIGDFLWTFIDQENDQNHLRMIFGDRIGD